MIEYTIEDLKGISLFICMYKILLEGDYKIFREYQVRLSPNRYMVNKEILKLLEARVIYPISDRKWISSVHIILKNGGTNVIKNDKSELVTTRMVTRGGCVLITRS